MDKDSETQTIDTIRRVMFVIGAGALIAVLIALIFFAITSGSASSGESLGSGPTRPRTPEPISRPIESSAPTLVPTPKPVPQPTVNGPRLHGPTPKFGRSEGKPGKDHPGRHRSVARPRAVPRPDADRNVSAAAVKLSSSPRPEKSKPAERKPRSRSTASQSLPDLAKGPPAGASAVKVAEAFAEDFIVYETGGPESTYREGFKETVAAPLLKSLLHRPPRQPRGAKVPRAKILNVVPGPSRDGVYALSVSLLRVHVTSELRLEMEQRGQGHKSWRVTDVLG